MLPLPTLTGFAIHNPSYLTVGLWPVAPLATPDLVRFTEQLPTSWRSGKALFRALLQRAGLPALVTHPKRPEPFRDLMQHGLRRYGLPLLRRLLREGMLLADNGHVDPAALTEAVKEAEQHGQVPSLLCDTLTVELGLRSLTTSSPVPAVTPGATVNPTDLTSSNLLYRCPEWYDEVQTDPSGTAVRAVEDLIADYVPDATTVVEFGCGTAADLQRMATSGVSRVGVDLQPAMIAHARLRHPDLDLRIGDMRTARLTGLLGSADVVACLGNSLAYLHTDDEIGDALATFAAHLHPGGLLVLFTPIQPPATGAARTSRVDTASVHGTVTIRYEWNPQNQISTLHRHWLLDDGRTSTDVIRRRVISPGELHNHLNAARFQHLETFADPARRNEPVDAPSAYTAARLMA
ncbi:bifunctional 2-polyprenyl-6-hydroxyphenol methylase/3-demethylubiquinol 3-O-methyltransferase UbiG [Saccharopolyspora spinosa]|uniref:class I SAM-dependent methyltransferase n=1 Tax=Saccharopolyspora spinosa TaxID=60894 RepID=UPI0011D27B9D|nr:class I SAM-dependent methyltransferase [Saccharopolyspora spinosa]